MVAPPQPGDIAPDFTARDQRGAKVQLSALRGHPVVLYFYPKDNTSGCTLEAQEFQSHLPEFQRLGVVVIGVSPDSGQSHGKFAEKHSLGFTLVPDTDHAIATRYGAWGEKSLYGRRYMGILRSTFLIGPDGTVLQTWTKVKPKGHAEEVLEAVREL
ncbi:MAG: thioredoxin-dependent thiol peroxidase [Candidatus Hydrogenedentes bacterium]|nr:thioredoxin-dependent thiol peroxidase [Candidatus Hydrogenedentota bacterium]